jgi:tetratricopeptide (TPR) repeat protein
MKKIILLQICFLIYLSSANAQVSEVEIYIANLNGQIEGFDYKSKQEVNNYLPQMFLSQLWYEKSGYTGNPYDTAKAIELSTKAIEQLQNPSQDTTKESLVNLYLMRARQQMRLHKFDQARIDISSAKKIGASELRLNDLLIDLDWNQGRYKKSLSLAQKKLAKAPNRLNLIHLAGLEHELGKFKEADVHYQAARAMSNDGLYFNPIQLAWLDVQIGINFSKLNNYVQAELAFNSAINRAPNYIMALEHLAETLALVGRNSEAISIYEKIVSQSDDPEFMGQLAKLYRMSNRTDEANRLASKAKEKYLQLLKDFPEAMYWHASSFFLEEGQDPELALDLLKKNIKLRPNSTSYFALAKVQFQLNQINLSKNSITKVLRMPPTSVEICDFAKSILNKNNPVLNSKCNTQSP